MRGWMAGLVMGAVVVLPAACAGAGGSGGGGAYAGSGGGRAMGEAELEVVESVDLERYMGTWYEIARYPNRWQKDMVAVTVEYELRDGSETKFRIRNEGRVKTLDGRVKTSKAKARVVDQDTNAKIKVQFIWPFEADYWIIDLCDAYQWAVVGQPSRNNLWIIARDRALDDDVLDGIRERLHDQGYDPDRLEMTRQPQEEPEREDASTRDRGHPVARTG